MVHAASKVTHLGMPLTLVSSGGSGAMRLREPRLLRDHPYCFAVFITVPAVSTQYTLVVSIAIP